VAVAIKQLHDRGRASSANRSFPLLADFLGEEVLPRIQRRAQSLDLHGQQGTVNDGVQALVSLTERSERRTLLHADLYRENAPFDEMGQPILIDPLPMVGDSAFDWAFWSVYYDLGRQTRERLAAAVHVSGIPASEILPWCRLLALDGYLYYLDTHDPRATRMAETLSLLSEEARRLQ